MTYAATQGLGAKEREAFFFPEGGMCACELCWGLDVCVLGDGRRVGVCVCVHVSVYVMAQAVPAFRLEGRQCIWKANKNVGQM